MAFRSEVDEGIWLMRNLTGCWSKHFIRPTEALFVTIKLDFNGLTMKILVEYKRVVDAREGLKTAHFAATAHLSHGVVMKETGRNAPEFKASGSGRMDGVFQILTELHKAH